MTIIEPVDPADVEAQRLGKTVESFKDLGDADAVFPRILAHAPGYAKALWEAMDDTRLAPGIDVKLKEIIRIQLARHAGDPYFSALRSRAALDAGLTEDDIEAGCGDFENDDRFSNAEKWALRYAHLMYREPDKVDAAFYDAGKQHFTEAQIMELGGMIAVHYGMQVFMRTLAEAD